MSNEESLARAQRKLGLRIIPDGQDREPLLQLIQKVYSEGDIRDPHYLQWEYDTNPAGQAIVRIGEKDNAAVGQYAVIPMRYQWGNTAVKGSLSVNTLTHPDFRGKGIFMLLANPVYEECRRQQILFTLGFPNPHSHKGFLRHLDFKDIGELPLWVRPMNLKRLANTSPARHHGIVRALLSAAHPLWSLWTGILDSLGPKASARVTTIDSFNDSFNDLWERVKGQYFNLLVRDRTFLEWRYRRHPTRQYRIFTSSDKTGLKGYLITRVMEVEGVRCGMLADLLTEKTSEGRGIARELIATALAHFEKEQVDVSGCLMPWDSPAVSGLWRAGYLPCPKSWLPQRFPVILRWHGENSAPASAYNLKEWYLTMGDYDVV